MVMSMSRNFHFVIVGGGILGSALAALAAGAGMEPLVLRRSDVIAPNADTLRNQGWLQSGVMYPISHFENESAYRSFAAKTFFAGRQLLEICGLPIPNSCGLLGVSEAFHVEQLTKKRALLNLSEHEFRELESDEADRILGAYREPLATYYRIPDAPFNEAMVLDHFRREAIAGGAQFVEVDHPVSLARVSGGVKILFDDGREIESPIVVVTAGVGSFGLMQQCGVTLEGTMQRTPLVVGDAPLDMPAPIMIDLDRGFSAVRHERGGDAGAAVVMGTRAKTLHDGHIDRVIPHADQQKFLEGVPPVFQSSMATGRYTAGYEVMPQRSAGVSAYEPWIKEEGPLLFASPGRATVSFMAAQDLFQAVLQRWLPAQQARTTHLDLSCCAAWDSEIAMHYTSFYSFNDAEA